MPAERRGGAALHDAPVSVDGLPTRRRDVQGLRALAVALVVAFHTGLPLPGGFIGVDVFFVISGFVITGMLSAEHARTGRVRLSTFYARRVRRILPAVAVMLSAVAVLGLLLLSPLGPQQMTAKTGTAASVFLANVQLAASPAGYFDPVEIRNALLHTWTLSVEEQFYLVYPTLFIGAWSLATRLRRSRPSPATVAAVLIVTSIASFALSWKLSTPVAAGLGPPAARLAFYSSPTRAWEFLTGAVLALALPRIARLSRPTAVTTGAVGLLAILAAAFRFDAGTPFPSTAALIPVFGTCLLIIAGTSTNRGVTALLSTAPAVTIGDLSYSWYLWHWPFIVFAASIWPGSGTRTAVVAAGVALIPAVGSYAFVENRFRFRSDLLGWRAAPLALACIVVPAVLCLSLVAVSHRTQSAGTRALVDSQNLHDDVIRGCNGLEPVTQRPADCTWSVPSPHGTVYLVGDSNAGHFTEPIAAASNELGYDFVAATSAGCGFADLVSIENGDELAKCRVHVAEAMHTFVAIKPSVVVISSSTPDIIWTPDRWLKDPYTGEIARSQTEKLDLYQRTMTRQLADLEAAGIHAVLVHTIPHLHWSPLDCGIDVYLSPSACATVESRARIEHDQAPFWDAEQAALNAVPAATGLDLIDSLCPAKVCSPRQGDIWAYHDGGHLSIAGATALTPRFALALSAALVSPTTTRDAPPTGG